MKSPLQIHRGIARSSSAFCADLAFFWHGILGHKKYPFNLYSSSARDALRDEIVRACSSYCHSGEKKKAERLLWLWESINLFIIRQNMRAASGQPMEKGTLPPAALMDMLKLLYAGEKAYPYWSGFSRRYRIPYSRAPIPSFWDHFDSFQPARLNVADWLAFHSHGKILDLGAGSFSYIPVHTAADISKIALAKNKTAKKKIVITPLGHPASLRAFSPASFDSVTLNSILSYLPEKSHRPLFLSIRRILREGGTLLITNAPIQSHHPAMVFVKSQVDAKGLAKTLRACGFEVEDESSGPIIQICARKNKLKGSLYPK